MARWSSGQDASLSRWKHGFDSRTGHQKRRAPIIRCSSFLLMRLAQEHTQNAKRFEYGFAFEPKAVGELAHQRLGKKSSPTARYYI